ncbi:SpaH/EbpB family LPXTG-anchored major pilin [Schaalia sp. JY-X169]|uniref:SpaH/EbpB family LPXTG-anchored major pilin n=1 Tax=Schaalia sp. JY-X169 TaxID=2758572 RepID=UPI0015F6D557|nr:SpaH/EbpB family LPXTG-anchored major pilin [Schaalia sp. JY-X169]
MSRTKTTFARRALASVGAAALGLMGVVGLSTSAMALSPSAEQINPSEKGSIIVHKHVKDDTSAPGNPKGDPLEGVTFKVQEVLYDGDSIPLATAEGWELAEALGTTPTPTLPAGYSLTNGTSDETAANGQVTFSGLGVGMYLVTETASGDNLITQKAAPFFVTIPMPVNDEEGNFVKWEYNVHAYPKNVLGTVTPTKTPNDPNHKVWETGTTVAWDITIPVPAADQDFTSFVITDTAMTGLEFTSWGDIKIGSQMLTAGTAGPPETGDYYVAGSVLTFTKDGLTKLNAGRAEAQTVTAVVNTTVKESPDGKLVNEVVVKINGEPGTGSGSTNWGDIVLTKKSVGTDTKLSGAVFDIYDAKNGTKIGTLTDKGDGTYTANIFVGNGTTVERQVWLKEVTAPSGHVLPADPWSGPYTIKADAQTSTTVTIDNHKPKGPELPLTGANGTMLMTMGGIGLVAVAGGLYLATRRKAHQE